MNSIVTAIALVSVLLSVNQASATYRGSQNPSMQERAPDELSDTSSSQSRASDTSSGDAHGPAMLTAPEPEERAPFGSGNKIMPASEAERRWFEQAQGAAW